MSENVERVREALSFIPADDRNIWVKVGMGLKADGQPYELFDEWSATGNGYNAEENLRQWESFTEEGGITISTVFSLAKMHGYTGTRKNEPFKYVPVPICESPVKQFEMYLSALFKPGEYVSICTEAKPSKKEPGKYDPRERKHQLFDDLFLECDSAKDIEELIGSYNHLAGAWIGINPLDGTAHPGRQKGTITYTSKQSVCDYRHVLIESDDTPIPDQYRILTELKLPIVTLTHSGKSSLHAVCRIDAENEEQFKERYDFLLDTLTSHGYLMDDQNRDVNKLTRMPGVQRGDQVQFLLGVNLGMPSWDEWVSYIEKLRQEKQKMIELISLDAVEEKEAEWLIPQYIPKGCITIIGAEGGIGKGLIWSTLAAEISRGDMSFLEGGSLQPRVQYDNKTVIVFSSEDSVEITIRKRLRNAGADLTQIKTIPLEDDRFKEVKFGSELLKDIIRQYKPALVIFDPLQAFISTDKDMAKRNHMRAELEPLIALGVQYGTSFIVVMHTNKMTGAYGRQRLADSADMWDIARSVLLCGRVPGSEGLIYISHEKSNYGEPGETVISKILSDGKLIFCSTDDRKDRDFIIESNRMTEAGKKKDYEAVKNTLFSALFDEKGKPCERLVTEVDEELKQLYSSNEIRTAKEQLKSDNKIRLRKDGMGGKWYISSTTP